MKNQLEFLLQIFDMNNEKWRKSMSQVKLQNVKNLCVISVSCVLNWALNDEVAIASLRTTNVKLNKDTQGEEEQIVATEKETKRSHKTWLLVSICYNIVFRSKYYLTCARGDTQYHWVIAWPPKFRSIRSLRPIFLVFDSLIYDERFEKFDFDSDFSFQRLNTSCNWSTYFVYFSFAVAWFFFFYSSFHNASCHTNGSNMEWVLWMCKKHTSSLRRERHSNEITI